jgi:hypothetical protein
MTVMSSCKRAGRVALLALVLAPLSLQAQGTQSGQTSSDVSDASGLVLLGTLSVGAGAAMVVVSAVKEAGDSTMVVLREVGGSAETVVEISSTAASNAGVYAGQVVSVAAESGGYALMAGGTLLAFIPNELGKELLYHAQRNR